MISGNLALTGRNLKCQGKNQYKKLNLINKVNDHIAEDHNLVDKCHPNKTKKLVPVKELRKLTNKKTSEQITYQ